MESSKDLTAFLGLHHLSLPPALLTPALNPGSILSSPLLLEHLDVLSLQLVLSIVDQVLLEMRKLVKVHIVKTNNFKTRVFGLVLPVSTSAVRVVVRSVFITLF